MKKILFAMLAVGSVATMAFTFSDALPIGSKMPMADSKMKDITGKEVAMADVKKENGVLVMFSCNTCPYVIKNQERIIEIGRYAKKNNIGVIIINSNEAQRGDEDSFDAMKRYAKSQGFEWSYVVDKNNVIADAFGATRTPECYLFNKVLNLAYHGAIDDNPSDQMNVTRAHLKVAIDELVTNKEITVTESKSVGCTIKRKSQP
jgi:peroxiredoxin